MLKENINIVCNLNKHKWYIYNLLYDFLTSTLKVLVNETNFLTSSLTNVLRILVSIYLYFIIIIKMISYWVRIIYMKNFILFPSSYYNYCPKFFYTTKKNQ